MRTGKVAVSLEKSTLERLDQMVAERVFPSRSGAIQQAVEEKLARIERTRLAAQCAKLDRRDEQALAEEGMLEEPEA
jgi:metal-responsive CopG/Arc/MetJ family transcriptional regulator